MSSRDGLVNSPNPLPGQPTKLGAPYRYGEPGGRDSTGQHFGQSMATWHQMCSQLADQLANGHQDPFVMDTIVIPSVGHQRCLSQFIASSDDQGICAGIEFKTLPTLRRELTSEYLAINPNTDPWRPRDLTLAILRAFDAVDGQPWFAPLAHHLAGCPSQTTTVEKNRRAVTARRVGALFRGYLDYAPQLIAAWNEGLDQGPDGRPLADDQLWQARLWRQLTTQSQLPDPLTRHRLLCDAISERPWSHPGGLFALTVDDQCDADEQLLAVLADNAGLQHWRLALPTHLSMTDSASNSDEDAPPRSLLRSRYAGDQQHPAEASVIDLTQTTWPASPRHTLQHLQEDIRADRAPTGRYRADGSVQIHLSHGPERQVEVLREVLTGLFEDIGDLEPREVLILSPQLDRYSAHLRACFSPAEEIQHPGQLLRAQLSGTSTSVDNPMLDLAKRLLSLPDSRAFRSDLLELIAQPAVSQRFDLRRDDVDELAALLTDANTSWGIDAKHRRSFGLQQADGTWWQSIERMLLGLALDSSAAGMLGGTVPIDSMRSDDMHRVGALAELVSRIRSHLIAFEQPASAAVWAGRLRAALTDLVAPDFATQWQLQQALGLLAEWSTIERSVDPDSSPAEIDYKDIEQKAVESNELALSAAEVLAIFDQWAPRALGRPNFGNGTMLIGNLGELAAVEHRVIVLLGVDDDIFPARSPKIGDDLLAGKAGDHRRSASRRHFLAALLAAQEVFIVIAQGSDERTNARLPEPVAVLDLLSAMGRSVDDDAADQHAVIRRHGLQAHSWSNFTSAEVGRPLSFDERALAGAIQLSDPPVRRRTNFAPWTWQFPQQPWDEELSVAQLADFLRNPARFLLRDVHSLYLRADLDVEREMLPLQQDALAQYAITAAILDDLLAGASAEDAISSELGRGRVLRNEAGWDLLNAKCRDATAIYRRLQQARGGQLRDVDCVVDLDLPLGPVRLTSRVRMWDDQIVHYTAGRANENRRIKLWLDLLIATASQSATGQISGRLVSRDDVLMRAPDQALAIRLLSELVCLRHAGKQQVVPLPLKAARVQAQPPRPYQDAEVRSAWFGARKNDIPGEREDPYWKHFFPVATELFEAVSHPDDPISYRSTSPAPGRFVQLSRWLFDPMNAHERHDA